MGLLASMVITGMSSTGLAVNSMPVADMQTCRKDMVAYVDEMPGANVMRKQENSVTAVVTIAGRNITFYVKCQLRNAP